MATTNQIESDLKELLEADQSLAKALAISKKDTVTAIMFWLQLVVTVVGVVLIGAMPEYVLTAATVVAALKVVTSAKVALSFGALYDAKKYKECLYRTYGARSTAPSWMVLVVAVLGYALIFNTGVIAALLLTIAPLAVFAVSIQAGVTITKKLNAMVAGDNGLIDKSKLTTIMYS